MPVSSPDRAGRHGQDAPALEQGGELGPDFPNGVFLVEAYDLQAAAALGRQVAGSADR